MRGTRRAARALLVVACAALATPAAPARAEAVVDDPALRTRETRLQNGLTVLTLEDRSTPVVSLQVWVRAGSGDETRPTGLAHLFEHMMFRGTDDLEAEEFERLVEARGGRINAFTTPDVTVYFSDVAPEHLPLVIELEAERLADLDVGEASLASEREVVLEERQLRVENSPQGLAYEALLALTFQAHPYRNPTIGWRADVAATTVEDCRSFFSTHYAPGNLVPVIAGDFDEADALARLRRAFARLAAAPPVRRASPGVEPEQRGERRAQVRYDVAAPVLAAAWHAPAAGHPDAEALDVASQILSAGRSSRLYRRLVYEEELALGAAGAYAEMRDAGLFYAWASVRPGTSVDAVEPRLFGEIARLREEPVSAAELEKARRALELGLLQGLDTSHGLASRVASDYVLLGRVRPLAERLAAIERVSADDVRRVARSYLVDERRSVVRVVPPEGGRS